MMVATVPSANNKYPLTSWLNDFKTAIHSTAKFIVSSSPPVNTDANVSN